MSVTEQALCLVQVFCTECLNNCPHTASHVYACPPSTSHTPLFLLVIYRLVVEQQGCASSEDRYRESSLSPPLLTPPDHTQMNLTPSPSPSLSRARTCSVGDHKSVLKLVTHSILSKVCGPLIVTGARVRCLPPPQASQMEDILGEKLLVSVAEEASALLPTTAAGNARTHTHTHTHTLRYMLYTPTQLSWQSSSHSCTATLKRSRSIQKQGYQVKPFKKQTPP